MEHSHSLAAPQPGAFRSDYDANLGVFEATGGGVAAAARGRAVVTPRSGSHLTVVPHLRRRQPSHDHKLSASVLIK